MAVCLRIPTLADVMYSVVTKKRHSLDFKSSPTLLMGDGRANRAVECQVVWQDRLSDFEFRIRAWDRKATASQACAWMSFHSRVKHTGLIVIVYAALTCTFNGTTYGHGAMFNGGGCKSCSCLSGLVTCAVAPCHFIPKCKPDHELKTLPGRCCPNCVRKYM